MEVVTVVCETSSLIWARHIQICFDISECLSYLQNDMNEKLNVVHRDIKSAPSIIILITGDSDFSPVLRKLGDQGYTTVVAHLAVAQTGKVLRKSCGYTVPWNSLYGGEKASFESTHWRISNQPKHGVKYMRTAIVWEQRLFGMMVDILDFAFDEVLCNILLITADKEMSMVAQFLDDERNNVYIVVPKNEDHSVLENSRTLVFKSPPEL